ncbi:hypothetical protein Tco_0281977 [Tanacetum coccineum]
MGVDEDPGEYIGVVEAPGEPTMDSSAEDEPRAENEPRPRGAKFDLKHHMESERWPKIYTGIKQHLQKIYNGKKTALKSSATREYPSLIQTFFLIHTVGGVFLRDEDRALYEEMLRLQGLGSNIETGVPYTEDEIMAIPEFSSGSESGGCGDDKPGDDEDGGEDEDDEEDADS